MTFQIKEYSIYTCRQCPMPAVAGSKFCSFHTKISIIGMCPVRDCLESDTGYKRYYVFCEKHNKHAEIFKPKSLYLGFIKLIYVTNRNLLE